MTPDQIRAVRALLRENTTAFGTRLAVSKRTIEEYEQGRRRPRGLALRLLERLHNQHASPDPTYRDY
jgi:DNA-binding transcriptional regulator YiaG